MGVTNKPKIIGKKVKSESDQLKAYKEAKTPKEMVESWNPVPEAKTDVLHKMYEVYEEKMPEIITTLIQEPEIHMMERNLIPAKARELLRLALAVEWINTNRITSQVVAAKARGATDDEIMDCVELASYGVAKSWLMGMSDGIKQGYIFAEQMNTREKYAEARKAGRESIMSVEDELGVYKEAFKKTQFDMLASWTAWLGVSREKSEKAAKNTPFYQYVEHGERLNIIKDHFHGPIIEMVERRLKGHGLGARDKDNVEWIQCMGTHEPGGVAAHIPFLMNRGCSDDEIMEICYLFAIECHRYILEGVGPALAEGFRQAAELGL